MSATPKTATATPTSRAHASTSGTTVDVGTPQSIDCVCFAAGIGCVLTPANGAATKTPPTSQPGSTDDSLSPMRTTRRTARSLLG
jgi:hypothetical protein